MIKNISVIGAGSWGTALANLLADKEEYNVTLWVRKEEQAKIIAEKKRNVFYLPSIFLNEKLLITSDLKKATISDLLVIAVPSHAMRDIMNKIRGHINESTIIVSCTKGIEDETYLRMSQVINELSPSNRIAVLSGPNHAEEVALKEPTATVIASKHDELLNELQNVFATQYFRPYINNDVIGVELGGAFKNIIAVAIGILSGLNYKDNAQAATITRGLAEMSRLGLHFGAKPETFLGLSGIGDLIATCMSKHSRNRWAGEQIATGKSIENILKSTDMIVEGIRNISVVNNLAKQTSIEMPITHELFDIIYKNKNVKDAVIDLLNRDMKQE